MALIGCERRRTEPPQNTSKSDPPLTQEVALFLHSSTRRSMVCQKEKKNNLKKTAS